MTVPRVSPTSFRRLAYLAAVLLAVIVVTGAAVRLTGCGLGCPDWPRCTSHLARRARLATTRWSSS